MRIAIIGAGFSGLSVAWHLLAKADCEIVVYDPKGIGGGASGIATGLLHPYVGEQGRRSMLATEGLQATQELIDAAEKKLSAKVVIHRGIIRYVQDEEQKQMFLSHIQEFGDVRQHGDNSFWIESGMTIDCSLYLQGLWQMIAEKGAKLILEAVSDLKELADFDHIIVAAGAGVTKFPELSSLRMSVLKGQVLICRAPVDAPLLPASSIGKGYVALSQDARTCLVGSTYEREYLTETPNAELAKSLLFEKVSSFFPAVDNLEVIDCRAALRIVPKGHYFPIASCVKDNLWVLAGMGSRGLLYHALLGKQLAESVIGPSLCC